MKEPKNNSLLFRSSSGLRNFRILIKNLLICAFVSCLVFCGPPEEKPEDISDAEYFGLYMGRCFGFRGGQGGYQEVTVGVEQEHVIDGREVVELRYRLGGNLRRAEYLYIADGEIRVVRREDPGGLSADSEFEPPYLLTRRPLHASLEGPLRTSSQANAVDGSGSMVDWEISVNIETARDRDIAGFDHPVLEYPHFVDLNPSEGERRSDRFALSPELGFTMLDLHGDDFPQVHLVKVWESTEDCREIPLDSED